MPKFVIFGDPMGGFLASAKAAGAIVIDCRFDPFSKQVTRIHLSKSINSVINLPFKSIWSKYFTRNINISNDEDIYFIFCEAVRLTYQKAA